ncbi:hypothetical protein SDC9_200372 [bioreactor metagenome]|uniref:Uncharacterized protein n=1 Tax=bioreactor metagenome TaxID=1076179 RepID=A0A645INN0_9ZZZZ
MGKPAYDGAAFNFYRWLATFRMLNDDREIFGLTIFTLCNVNGSVEARCTCCVDAVFVSSL